MHPTPYYIFISYTLLYLLQKTQAAELICSLGRTGQINRAFRALLEQKLRTFRPFASDPTASFRMIIVAAVQIICNMKSIDNM